MVTLTVPAGDYMRPRSQTALGSRRTRGIRGKMSISAGRWECNTIAGYTAPVKDHNYFIKHGLNFSTQKFNDKADRKSQRYIDKIITRAKSQIDPQKYAH